MKRSGVLLLALCLFGAAGCGDDNTTAPTNQPMVFTAQLSPANEVPAISNAENTGRGAVQITFHVTRDAAGAVASGTVDFHFQLNAFPSTTTVVGAHIHSAAAGVNGGIVINTGVVATGAVTSTDGVITFSQNGVSASAATMQAIINNPAGFYFNVHSPLNPGGFARGQLSRTF